MSGSPVTVGLICVNFGSSKLLDTSLGPLAAMPGVAGVVVDNFSSESERQLVTELARSRAWNLVACSDNRGFGAGVNLGVQRARDLGCDILAVLNPDATMAEDDFARLVARVRESDGPLLVAPRTLRPDGSIWFAGSDLYLADGRIRSLARRAVDADGLVRPWLSGAVLAFSTRTWDLVGGFDEDYFLYWEDVDLSWRVLNAGGQLAVLNDVQAIHAEGGTQAQTGLEKAGQAKSSTYYYYNIRNRLLFAAKHLNAVGWRSWLVHTPAVSWEILLQGGRRQFLPLGAPVVPMVKGIVDGVVAGRRLRRTQSSSSSSPC